MKKPLWTPSEAWIKNANITQFMEKVNQKYGKDLKTYDDLYQWSVDAIPDFWASVWEFAGIRASKDYDQVVEDLTQFPGTKWFPGASLNFAENLLRYRDDHLAFVFRGEDKKKVEMTYAELYEKVARLAKSLRDLGIKPGDRVAGYMPNMIETAVAMLASTSVGATWLSCATYIGAQAALDRLGQIEPKVLYTVNGYYYKGKTFDSLANATEIAKGMPSLQKVVVASYTDEGPHRAPSRTRSGSTTSWPRGTCLPCSFEQLPFYYPVYIMFSSGTTGKPKCMVQGAGGILINHQKELLLHTDLKREDRILYITTCSWMMWNWLLSSLGVGATIVLYDGNPMHPDEGAVWKMLQDEKVTVFGTSASFINFVKSQGMTPGKDLRSVFAEGHIADRLPPACRRVRVRVPGDQTGSALQLDFGRHGHQRLLCSRQPDQPGIRGRTPGRGPGHEGEGVRRQGANRCSTSRPNSSARPLRRRCPCTSGTTRTGRNTTMPISMCTRMCGDTATTS